MKLLHFFALLASVVAYSACATEPELREPVAASEDFIFSIAHSNENDNPEGAAWERRIDVFFRYEDPIPSSVRGVPPTRLISCGKARQGEDGDLFGGGSTFTHRLEHALDDLNFQPFDYDQEVTAATQRMIQDADERAKKSGHPVEVYDGGTLDGSMFVITYHYKGTEFRIRAHEPGQRIDALAPFSPKIAQLKKLIEIFANAYGREAFRL